MIQEKKKASAQLFTLTQEMNKLKSSDTAITVYESKFQQMRTNDQKKDAIIRAKSDKIES